jgi:hypothetical protein
MTQRLMSLQRDRNRCARSPCQQTA